MNDFLVFDLETQRSAEDVGGWNNIPEMKMSVGVIWDSRKNRFFVYLQDKVDNLIDHLTSGPMVVGFNHLYFDYPVVSGYAPLGPERKKLLETLGNTKNLDLLINLKETLGHRLKLDSIVRPTLSIGKSADGLMALEWYKQYLEHGDQSKMDLIVDYCKQDVAVTRDLFLHGLQNQEVSYESKTGAIKTVSVDWTGQQKKAATNSQLSF